jgi:hypothetical protein
MTKRAQTTESEVLFQKLGETWYVFTEIAGEMVFSPLPNGVDPYTQRVELFATIEDHMKKVSKIEKRRRNSEAAA